MVGNAASHFFQDMAKAINTREDTHAHEELHDGMQSSNLAMRWPHGHTWRSASQA